MHATDNLTSADVWARTQYEPGTFVFVHLVAQPVGLAMGSCSSHFEFFNTREPFPFMIGCYESGQ